MHSKIFSAALALAASSLVSAQTFTDCDPTKKDCPPNPAFADSVTIDLTRGEPKDHIKSLPGTTLSYDNSRGAIFTIKSETDAPTVASNKYIFFGRIDVTLVASPGAGIVTSVVLQSDDLDEIDIEFVGGDTARVQSNYFSKGDTSTYDRGQWHNVARPMAQEHTYSIDWTKDRVQWLVDGAVVRTLTYQAAKGGSTFPQTPMQIKFGTWVAGKRGASQGTIEWAGGYADFSRGPFVASYKSVKITDYMGGVQGAKQYIYGDRSGSYRSIKIDTGSGAATTAAEVPDESSFNTTAPVGSVASAVPDIPIGKASAATRPAVGVEPTLSPTATDAAASFPDESVTLGVESYAPASADEVVPTATSDSVSVESTLLTAVIPTSNATAGRFVAASAPTGSDMWPEQTSSTYGSGRASPSAQVFVAAADSLRTPITGAALAGGFVLVARLFL